MAKIKDIKGQRFGKLVALSFVGTKNGYASWLCQCDCGNTKEVLSANIVHGKTKSCGCIHDELMKTQFRTHGEYRSKEYNCWVNIRERCGNPNVRSYKDYGAKGIKVCERWQDFENFIKDMGRAPSKSYTIERIDSTSDYEPANCRWATMKEQQNNRANNKLIEYKGVTKTKAQWADDLGISYGSLQSRINRGWSMDRILSTPINSYYKNAVRELKDAKGMI